MSTSAEHSDAPVRKVHEYRGTTGVILQAFICCAILAGIGWFSPAPYNLVLSGLALGLIVYALVIASDQRVRLRIDDEGISNAKMRLAWSDVRSYSVVELTRGATIRHELRLTTADGQCHPFQISRLDTPAAEILLTVGEYLKAT